jgi:hypothetical protein
LDPLLALLSAAAFGRFWWSSSECSSSEVSLPRFVRLVVSEKSLIVLRPAAFQ